MHRGFDMHRCLHQISSSPPPISEVPRTSRTFSFTNRRQKPQESIIKPLCFLHYSFLPSFYVPSTQSSLSCNSLLANRPPPTHPSPSRLEFLNVFRPPLDLKTLQLPQKLDHQLLQRPSPHIPFFPDIVSPKMPCHFLQRPPCSQCSPSKPPVPCLCHHHSNLRACRVGTTVHKIVKNVDGDTFALVLMVYVGALIIRACVMRRTGHLRGEAAVGGKRPFIHSPQGQQ